MLIVLASCAIEQDLLVPNASFPPSLITNLLNTPQHLCYTPPVKQKIVNSPSIQQTVVPCRSGSKILHFPSQETANIQHSTFISSPNYVFHCSEKAIKKQNSLGSIDHSLGGQPCLQMQDQSGVCSLQISILFQTRISN